MPSSSLLFTIRSNSLLLLLFLLLWTSTGEELSRDDGGPKVEALTQSKLPSGSNRDNLPIFPERSDAAYFVVAVAGGVNVWGRSVARTLLDMGDVFSSPHGPPLRPIYVDLPVNGRFSAKVLTTLCEQIEGIPISGIIVVGDGQAARSIALSGNAMKVPVLWAKGGTAQLQESSESQNYLQATLQPSAKEILEAIRAIFLQTHWHSFFVLSDIGSTMVLGGSLGNILKKAPLSPTILPLSSKDNNDEVFRQLAKISRSTRGIVLLLCDLNVARRIMSEATRLKMTGGHFIWIWADTSSTAEFFQLFDVSKPSYEDEDYQRQKVDPKYYQGQSQNGRRPQQNQTRYKSINSSRYHHIIGLRKPTDESSLKRDRRYQDDSVESDKINIKNINSHEFNANYYDPYVKQQTPESNVFTGTGTSDFDDYDYAGKVNPYHDGTDENLDLDNYSETSNDSKAKRANNFMQSTFNISSHVFFHHFKEFPVGLLALKHIKMNVDRTFVRSAIRLFASTWARVEKNEEIRLFISGGKSSLSSRRDFDDYGENNNYRSKTKNNNKVNNRNNVRGSSTRKFKRDTQENVNVINNTSPTTERSILTLVNTSINLNNSESDLKQHQLNNSGTNEIKSNISNLGNKTVNKDNKSSMQKRSWWSPNSNQQTQRRAQEKAKVMGTPQYKGGCFGSPNKSDIKKAEIFSRYLREAVALALSGKTLPGTVLEKQLISNFEILNLVPTYNKEGESVNNNRDEMNRKPTMTPATKSESAESTKWRRVGLVLGRKVHLDTIVWPGGDIVVSGLSARARSVFRVVTSVSPPFVMESNLDEDGLCLRGLPCHRLSTSGKQNLTLMFNSIETNERSVEDAVEHGNQIPLNEDHKSNEKVSYKTRCCYGLSMDLLDNVASELGFGYILYIVGDGVFGSKELVRRSKNSQTREFNRSSVIAPSTHDTFEEQLWEREKNERNARKFNKRYHEESQWNGIIGDLVAGTADMSFAPLSVSKTRAEVIDFSVPYFHSGVSLLAAPKVKTDIPLLAFLMPFSPELWIAVFIWLNLTAIAVAIYEWLSPFGLNPWGRQRSKNFSLSSALWVMWGLLFGHLVAFKAPKSWPNKFLINVWGGFSVIFIASYTANIAALIAGLFFHNAANTYDTSLLTQRVGIPRASAAESYIQRNDKHLWERMKKYTFNSIEDGIQGLKNGTIDLLMADTPILDYYRGSDHGCNLRRIGENYIEDTYAIGMSKGFPLKESISALIAKYSSNGYLDILLEKWYGGLPCYHDENDIEIVQPRPLGVAAVAGVFLLLGLGMILGVFILIFEHMFFKYYLPMLRHKPKGSMWRSRNLMFFSQKLYRFINCVELVSPHHAARELVHTLRKGHITSLFQKSVKRKEDEQRRRRKSKAQFFEMIQEIRRVQQEEKEHPPVPKLEVVEEVETQPLPSPNPEIQSIASSATSTSVKPKSSPKVKIFSLKRDGHARSNSSSLNVRRFSTDSILGERLDTIGRRLSRDIASDLANSPPDLGHRFETFGKSASSTQKFDTFSGKMGITKSADDLDKSSSVREKSKFDTFSGTLDDVKPELPAKKNTKTRQQKRKPLSSDTYTEVTFGNQSTLPLRDSIAREPIKESFRETLHPAIFQLDKSKAILRDKLHEELKEKYGVNKKMLKSKPPKVPSTSNRPPLRVTTSNPNDSFLKVQSNDSLHSRPIPSPRATKSPKYTDDDDDDCPDPTYATILPRNKTPRPPPPANNSNLQLGRLSKEDLLNLSQRTESEIHEFLNGKPNNAKQKSRMDPP